MGKTMKKTMKDKRLANLKPMKKGETRNPNGRPKGQRNYATIAKEAMKKLADASDKTPEEIEELINLTGLKKALKGDYQFYRDHQDRTHGKAPQPLGTVEDGELKEQKLEIVFTKKKG